MYMDRGWMRRSPLGGLIAVAVSAGIVVGCAASDGGEAQAQPADGQDVVTVGARVINIEAQPVVLSDFVDYIRLTGEVEALHDVTISAEESGTLARFLVEKGSRVSRDQVIAKIDDAVLAAQVNEAQALADIAQEQYERQRRLWEDQHMGSEIAYLQSKSSTEAANARLATLQARLDRTEIRAPVAGIFDDNLVEAGELVAPGTPIAHIVSTHRVKVVGGVPERFALDVRPGSRATVMLDVLTGQRFEGVVSFVGSSVDTRNRTFPIEIVIDNADGSIKPHMLANVQVVRARLENVVVVPQDVVQRAEDGYQIFVVATGETGLHAEARDVRLGPSYGNQVVVESGLSVGDRLITVGHGLVDDGSQVSIVSGAREEG
jgi:membrane fusion protein (multidrug efflux system)